MNIKINRNIKNIAFNDNYKENNIFCPYLDQFLDELHDPYWERLKINPMDCDFRLFVNKHWDRELEYINKERKENFNEMLVPIVAKYLEEEERIFIRNHQFDFSSYEKTCKSIEIIEQLACDSYVVESLQAQGKAWKALVNAKKLSKEFPFLEMYKFAINGDRQVEGKYIFEDEAGYIVGVFNAITWSLDSNNSIDGDWFIKLHEVGMKEVFQKISNEFIQVPSELGITCYYGIGNRDQDSYGTQDILNRGTFVPKHGIARKNMLGSELFFIHSEENNGFERSIIQACDSQIRNTQKRKAELDFLFQCLNVFLDRHKGEKNSGLRLLGILWLARQVVTNHFFPDGNGRSAHMIPNAFIARDEDLGSFMLPYDPDFYVANGPQKILFRSILASQNFIDKGKNLYFKKRSNKNRLLSSFKTDRLHQSLHSLVAQSINLIQTYGSAWGAYHILFMNYNRMNIPRIIGNKSKISAECKELLSVVNEKIDYSDNIIKAIINIKHLIKKNELRLKKLKNLLSEEKSLITLLLMSEKKIRDLFLEVVLSSEQN